MMEKKENTGEEESMENQMDLAYSKTINVEWKLNGKMECNMGK